MTVTEHPTQMELLELDIDVRMASLWADVLEYEEWNDDSVLALMRAAYAKGYSDALVEEERGLLCRQYDVLEPAREKGWSPGFLRGFRRAA